MTLPVEEAEVEVQLMRLPPPIMPGTWTRFSMNARDPVDRERRDEVQHRHREVDLDAARGLLLRLHREHRQLGDAHRERHRRVLDDVHRLAGERRDDDAERHRQQHVAVGLRQREAHRQAGVALALAAATGCRRCTCSEIRAEVKKPSAKTTSTKLGTPRSDRKIDGMTWYQRKICTSSGMLRNSSVQALPIADQRLARRRAQDAHQRADDQRDDQRQHARPSSVQPHADIIQFR